MSACKPPPKYIGRPFRHHVRHADAAGLNIGLENVDNLKADLDCGVEGYPKLQPSDGLNPPTAAKASGTLALLYPALQAFPGARGPHPGVCVVYLNNNHPFTMTVNPAV